MSGVALGFVETRVNNGTVIDIDAMMKTVNVELVKRVEIGIPRPAKKLAKKMPILP